MTGAADTAPPKVEPISVQLPPLEPRTAYQKWVQFWIAFNIGNLFGNFVSLGLACYGVFWYFEIPVYVTYPFLAFYAYDLVTSKAHLKGGRAWDLWRKGFRSDHYYLDLFADYFPCRVLNPEVPNALDLDKRQYFFAVAPHGIHCFPMIFMTYWNRQVKINYRRVVGLVATVIFYVPVMREIFLWANYRDVRREVCAATLREGNSVCVVVGGEAETLANVNGRDRVVLGSRFGFIKLCIQTNTPAVPVYGFGNSDTYVTLRFGYAFRRWIAKRFKLCIPLFWGRFGTPMPLQTPISVVFGEPQHFPHVAEPSTELIAQCHAQYVRALQTVYEQYKAAAGYPNRTLEIIDA